MLQRTLPALLATALWTSVMAPAAPAMADKKAVKAAAPAAASVRAVESEVVGSVNGKPVMTFGQLIEKVQKASPPAFAAAIGQVVGQDVTSAFFGATPKPQVTFTRLQVLQELRAHPPQALGTTLQQDLTQEAIRQAGVKYHAEPTNAQLDAIVTYLVKQQRLRMGAQVPPSVTDDQFIGMLRPGLTRAKLRSDPDIRVSATMFNLAKMDIEKKLKHPIGEADFVEARHILVKADPLPANATPEAKKADAEALAKITKIYDDLKAGRVKFEQAVAADSDDAGSKANGGSLGIFMPDGSMVKEFQDVAFSTKPGEISKPFRSQFGYHILEVTKTGKEMKPEERQSFLMDKERSQSNLTYQAIASQAKIVNKLQPEPTIRIPGGPGGPGRPPGQ
jgi:peptidyl-prolyl cis-trans isomerase SurA